MNFLLIEALLKLWHNMVSCHAFGISCIIFYFSGSQGEIDEAVKSFLLYTKELKNVAKLQIACHVAATIYIDHLSNYPGALDKVDCLFKFK